MGSHAHDIAAQMFKTRELIHSNKLDQEGWESVEFYVDFVKQEANGNPILVEVKFDLSAIHPGLFGTADAVIYHPAKKLLQVIDYKHGSGILVEAENNLQLQYYALGALLHTNFPCSDIEVIIVQPRANHEDGVVRRWKFKSLEIVSFARELKQYALDTEKPDAKISSGSHCRFCSAAAICPVLSSKSLTVAKTDFSSVLPYDPLVLADTLNKLEMLEAYAKSVREFAYRESMAGRTPPGFKLVEKRATRKWKDEDDARAALASRVPNGTELFDFKMKSPAQIEKLKPAIAISDLVVAVSSGLTLVPDTDKRPKALSIAESDFKDES